MAFLECGEKVAKGELPLINEGGPLAPLQATYRYLYRPPPPTFIPTRTHIMDLMASIMWAWEYRAMIMLWIVLKVTYLSTPPSFSPLSHPLSQWGGGGYTYPIPSKAPSRLHQGSRT